MADIYFLGDIHLGSALCDEEKLAATIEEIRVNPNAICILMGDECDYISPKDWRWRDGAIAEWVDTEDVAHSQQTEVVSRLRPIKKKILGAIEGNHERTIRDEFNQNVHNHLVEELEIRDFGYSALVRLRFYWKRNHPLRRGGRGGETHLIDIFLHHGFGGGRTDAADMGRFSDIVRDYVADWFIMGHTHRYFASKFIKHYLGTRGDILSKPGLIGRSGTFLKTLDKGKFSYSEKAAMRPLYTGCLKVTYSPDRNDVVAQV